MLHPIGITQTFPVELQHLLRHKVIKFISEEPLEQVINVNQISTAQNRAHDRTETVDNVVCSPKLVNFHATALILVLDMQH